MEKLFPVVEDERLTSVTAYVDGDKVRFVTGIGRPNGILALQYEDRFGRVHWAAAERVTLELNGRQVLMDQLFDNLVPIQETEPAREPQGQAYHRSFGVVDILDRCGHQILIAPTCDVLDLDDRVSFPDWDTDEDVPRATMAPRETWVDETELVPLSVLRFPTAVKLESDLNHLWIAQPPWSLDPVEGFLKILQIEEAEQKVTRGQRVRTYTVRQAICQVVWDERPDRIGRLAVVPASWLVSLATGERLGRGEIDLPDLEPADLQDYDTPAETVTEEIQACGTEPDVPSVRQRFEELLPPTAAARQDNSTEKSLNIAVSVIEFPSSGPFAICLLREKGAKPKTVKVWQRGGGFLVYSRLPAPVKALIIRKAVWMKAKLELARSALLSA